MRVRIARFVSWAKLFKTGLFGSLKALFEWNRSYAAKLSGWYMVGFVASEVIGFQLILNLQACSWEAMERTRFFSCHPVQTSLSLIERPECLKYLNSCRYHDPSGFILAS